MLQTTPIGTEFLNASTVAPRTIQSDTTSQDSSRDLDSGRPPGSSGP
jgi:hypothetical protein